MASTKTTKRRKTPKPQGGHVSFNVEAGTKTQVTIEAGAIKAGKVPVTIHVDHVEETPFGGNKSFGGISSSLRAGTRALAGRIRSFSPGTWLFIFAVIVYLVTRLIGLTQYPIYFFTDEAIQTQAIVDLAASGYRNAEGVLFPTYFRNGEYANLSLSVYLQWLPLVLFGKSAVVTRATSVLVTLIAAVSVGIILRDVFRAKYWWAGTLFLSITPSWFLHSRTAFETAEFTAFYAGTLCAYLLYRYKSPGYLYAALFLGALAFYTYSPGQLIVPITATALLLSDWRTHWEHRRTIFKGLVLLVIFAIPYIRYQSQYPSLAYAHLHTLGSYLLEQAPLTDKIAHYFSEYFVGLSALYWYVPNNRDLPRHLMDHYGNILVATLPFAVLGLAHVLRHLRESGHRTILVVMLTSPMAAALVQTGITRALIFVIPAALLTTIGLELVLRWVENPAGQLTELSRGLQPTSGRVLMGLAIFAIGIMAACLVIRENYDRVTVLSLATILALQVSGTFNRPARWFTRSAAFTVFKKWRSSQVIAALAVFIILSASNIYLLTDALGNGSAWSTDYGMGGMQYGAFQIFDILEQYKQDHPETRIVLTPNWANGTDVLTRFFLNSPSPIELGSIQGYIIQKFPLDDDTLFVMLPEEYALAVSSSKLKDVRVERILPYPDGSPGFHFVRLRYVDDIDEIFAAEKALRQVLQKSVVRINGEDVAVRYSYLEADAIQLVFDNDPLTLTKTFEANPYIIEMTFPSARTINGFSIIIGSASAKLTVRCYATPAAQPSVYTFEGQGSIQKPGLSFDLPRPTPVQVFQLEMLDPYSPAPAQIHIWELTLR